MGRLAQLGRRRFLALVTWAVGGLISAVYAIPAIAYLIGPSLRESEEAWQPLGSVAKLELGKPTLFKTTVEQQTGWITDRAEIFAYVLTDNGREFTAMSNICTHLGCRIRWIEEQGIFFCPCHNGVFDREGAVVSGPPPRPLDRYEVRIDDGQLFILLD